MTLTPDAILQLVHSTKSFSVWDREKGPVFWYALGVPGPFYINVEWILGKAFSERMLDAITAMLAETAGVAERAVRLDAIILPALGNNEVYRQIITTMARDVRQNFLAETYSFISGGERRDWLFSIPLARELGLKHIYLFKDKRYFCRDELKPGEAGIHAADLINNAASYFDAWLPVLTKAGLHCAGTACVVARGNGAQKLEAAGIKVTALQKIDFGFFEQSCAAGLIDQDTLEEIACYFDAPAKWAETYLMSKPELFNVPVDDTKAPARLKSFFTKDPWQLKARYPELFDRMAKN